MFSGGKEFIPDAMETSQTGKDIEERNKEQIVAAVLNGPQEIHQITGNLLSVTQMQHNLETTSRTESFIV